MGCRKSPGQNEGGYLSKQQVLILDPDADIFVYDDWVYKTGVDWIEDEELIIDEQIGEIAEGMATVLPVGGKIFVRNERKDILIVAYNGKDKRYLVQHGE